MLHLERATVPIPRILLMRPFILSFLALASGTFSLAAPETIPTSPEEQMRIFEEMAAKETFACYDTDEEGNIVFVGFNHAYHGRNPFTRPLDAATLVLSMLFQRDNLMNQPADSSARS